MHTQFTEESKMATALTPQTDITSGKSHVTYGEPKTVVWASLQKRKSLKNLIKLFFFFIKSETSDSFVSHFDGHFAYLKTLDFYFNAPESETSCIYPHPPPTLTSQSITVYQHTRLPHLKYAVLIIISTADWGRGIIY